MDDTVRVCPLVRLLLTWLQDKRPPVQNAARHKVTDSLCYIRSVAVAKKADRTAYDVRYRCKTERPKIPRLE